MPLDTRNLIACPDCDLLQRLDEVPVGAAARCSRCGAVLWRHRRDTVDRTLALNLTALVLFAVTNAFPFLALKSGSIVQQTTLLTGIRELYAQGFWALAAVVLLTTVVVPLMQIVLMLYLLLPLRSGRIVPGFRPLFRLIQGLSPWSMMEVFLLGILVSLVKLAKMAKVVPGLSLFAFIALIFVLAAAVACLDPRQVWKQVEG